MEGRGDPNKETSERKEGDLVICKSIKLREREGECTGEDGGRRLRGGGEKRRRRDGESREEREREREGKEREKVQERKKEERERRRSGTVWGEGSTVSYDLFGFSGNLSSPSPFWTLHARHA